MDTRQTCVSCSKPFEKGKKGYKRASISSITSPQTAGQLFTNINFTEADLNTIFVCYECVKVFRRKTVKKQTGHYKRTWDQRSTPLKWRPSSSQSPAKKKFRTTMVGEVLEKAAIAFQRHNYLTAFRWLCHRGSDSMKRASVQVFFEMIKKERTLLGNSKALSEPVTEENIEKFSWENVVEEGQKSYPLITGALQSMLPGVKQLSSISGKTKRSREEILKQRTGMMLSIVAHTMKPRKNKFFQVSIGLQLWRQGCSHQIFQTFFDLGLSQNIFGARGNIDRLRKGFDKEMVEWKDNVENVTSSKPEVKSKTVRKTLFPAAVEFPTYGVCWDNVQIQTHAKHQSSTKSNKMLLWGMCLGVQNRINFNHLSRIDVVPAKTLSPDSFLPTSSDYEYLKYHMMVIVEQILTTHLTALKELRQSVEWHIPHKYSENMCEKSHVVNLGVVNADPSSTSGSIDILTYLHKYVPMCNDQPLPILCSGDGLSVERMISAHRSRKTSATPSLRLEGLVECPQEFHKEILSMQDFMNTFFKPQSEAARGTLVQLKNFFNHRSLKKDVKSNVQHAWDMIEFVTICYVVLCAVTSLSIADVDDIPADYPVGESSLAKTSWLRRLAQYVVDFAWLEPKKEEIRKVAEASNCGDLKTAKDIFPYCSCLIDKDEPMVQCSSAHCKNNWSHLSCAQLEDLPPGDEDWFCSEECTSDGSYIYCICQKTKGGEMVQCVLQEKCRKYEWYHLKCIGKCDMSKIPDIWYCSEECQLGADQDDPVQNHTRAIMWEGLNLLARRDAVRSGNGEEILSHWRMDMINFWTKRHTKYFIIGHHLLARTSGTLPEHLAHDLTWNRLANLSGRKGGNIGIDLVNEFMNNDFKEMMKSSRGQYTQSQVDRCAQVCGPFGKKIDKMLSESGLASSSDVSSKRKKSYEKDVQLFVEDFGQDALFDYLPGIRSHQGFEGFTSVDLTKIKNSEQMGLKLSSLSACLDDWSGFRDC